MYVHAQMFFFPKFDFHIGLYSIQTIFLNKLVKHGKQIMIMKSILLISNLNVFIYKTQFKIEILKEDTKWHGSYLANLLTFLSKNRMVVLCF